MATYDSPTTSDSSEPVLVSRPSSPTPTPHRPALDHHDSPAVAPIVVHNSPNETVTVLKPGQANTRTGLGQPGQEELVHLRATPTVPTLGRAEGVVGAAHGAAPEYIARVAKADEDDSSLVGAGGASMSSSPSFASSLNTNDDRASIDGGADEGKKQPKWFRKVKESASSAASSIREKAKDLADQASVHSSGASVRESSPVSTDVDASASRARGQSIGSRSAVSFSLAEQGPSIPTSTAAPSAIRSSLDVPRPPQPPRIVTDGAGHPVPLNVGDNLGGATPTSSFISPQPAGNGRLAAGNVSMATSVKDSIVDQGYEVEPSTTQDKFHEIFKDIPAEEELIEDYRCALVRDILVQGKCYVSETYLSFRANILGWETSLKIPWTEIVSIEKRMTAKIIPNAIEVRTLHATHTFASFVARDASYDLIVALWRHVHPEADKLRADSRAAAKEERRRARALSTSSARSTGADSTDDEEDDRKSEITFEDEKGEKKRHRFKLPSGVTAAIKSIKGRDTAVDDGTVAGGAGGGGASSGPTEAEKVKARANAAETGVHPPTSYNGPEYKNEALDTTLPTTPLKAYKLFFKDEAFLRKFLEEKEQLLEVDIGAWSPAPGAAGAADEDHALLTRDMTYVKPLNAPVGPKQTHCNIKDLNESMDDEAGAIVNLTTTRTPDVPSGDNFSVVTRTVFTHDGSGGTKVRVTTEVEWTKVNRFLKGVIERGAIDGQKTYHADLEAAVRAHIEANSADYIVAGAKPAAVQPVVVASTSSSSAKPSSSSSSNDDGFLSFLPFDPVLGLAALVALLLISNLWTYLSLRSYASAAARARVGNPGEVASSVSRVLSEFNALHARRLEGADGAAGAAKHLGELVSQIRTLERNVVQSLKEVRELADFTEGLRDLF